MPWLEMLWVLGCGLYGQRFDCYCGLVCCLEGLEEEGRCCLACPRISFLLPYKHFWVYHGPDLFGILCYIYMGRYLGWFLAYDKAMLALHCVSKVSR